VTAGDANWIRIDLIVVSGDRNAGSIAEGLVSWNAELLFEQSSGRSAVVISVQVIEAATLNQALTSAARAIGGNGCGRDLRSLKARVINPKKQETKVGSPIIGQTVADLRQIAAG
jgi:hypothetical protein